MLAMTKPLALLLLLASVILTNTHAAIETSDSEVEYIEAELTGDELEDGEWTMPGTGGDVAPIEPGARGFNADIHWLNSLDEAKALAQATRKPLMLLIHNSACHACIKLKRIFSESDEARTIVDLSRGFVAVNLQDQEEPQGDEFKPDGEYIPRLFFLDSSGQVREDLYNTKGTDGYKYFYYRAEDVVREMENALEELKANLHEDL